MIVVDFYVMVRVDVEIQVSEKIVLNRIVKRIRFIGFICKVVVLSRFMLGMILQKGKERCN